ncbi:MAG: branched-chain amino acid ABC transporter permease [Pikeienuella sp.]
MIPERALNAALILGLAGAAILAEIAGAPFVVTLATKLAILALAGVGLNIALGLGGMVSFGHAAFFGLGGYAAGVLASHALNYEPLMESPVLIEGTTQMLVIWPVAMILSGIAALAIGALSLRTSGIFFIMITLAFAQMIYYFAISWPAYGGEDGLSIYVRSEFPGLDTLDPIQFFALAFALLCVALGFAAMLACSRFGLALQGARQNEARLRAVGIGPYRVRLAAFVISAMITGLAGALFADLNRFVSPTMLDWHTSGQIIVFVILGGAGRLCGPVAGAGLYILLEHNLGALTEFWQALLGLLLLLVVLFARGGLIGLLAKGPRHG